VWAVNVYSILLLIYALLSWIPDLRGRWSDYLALLIEPLLTPIRRIVPPLGGLDMAFLVLILLLQIIVRPLLYNLADRVCFGF
jgi:YggT family protein